MHFSPPSSGSAAQPGHLSSTLLKSEEVNIHLAGAVIVSAVKEKHHHTWYSLPGTA